MKILIIGGTGFMGPSAIPYLQKDGHAVTVFHRGKTPLPAGAEEIIGDHHNLANYRSEFTRLNFDVIIDLILSSGRQGKALMETFRGISRRVVALSSMDVYRAMGLLQGTESGALPAFSVAAVDTTGAGDAFNAGVIAALLEGADIDAALDLGVRVGSAVVARRSDARYPTRKELGIRA